MTIITLTKVPQSLDRPGQAGEFEIPAAWIRAAAIFFENYYGESPSNSEQTAKMFFDEVLQRSSGEQDEVPLLSPSKHRS